MSSEQDIIERLAGCGLRVTRARRAVVRALLESEGALTPAQACECARRHWPRIGLVTAYRTLELLAQLGLARRVHAADGCHGYTRASAGHHHNLICQRCGRVVEFEGCDLSALEQRVASETGFAIHTHILELTGVCPLCQNTDAGRRS
jgi:Fur family ferric uptake transcriptional regulator